MQGRNKGGAFPVVLIIAALLMILRMPTPAGASPFYKYDIIAQTGQAGLTAMGSPSINDKGLVAFTGTLDGGSSVFVGDGSGDPENITPGYVSNTRTFMGGVQINNSDKVVALDRASGNPPSYFLRTWDANLPNFGAIMAKGNSVQDVPYDAILLNPAINNTSILEYMGVPGGNQDGICDPSYEACLDQVVFSSMVGSGTFLSTPVKTPSLTDAGSYNDIPLTTPLYPMLADNGRIVVRAGNLVTDPIMLYSYDFDPDKSITIADSTKFTVLGRSPGISDDGKIVVFYGDLNIAGASELKTYKGPGIFAWDEDTQWIVRVAGLAGNGEVDPGEAWTDLNWNGQVEPGEDFVDLNENFKLDPGETSVSSFKSFDADSRVNVNSTHITQRAVAIAYMATDRSSKKGLYTNRLNFHPCIGTNTYPCLDSTQVTVGRATLVIRQGDSFDPSLNLLGTVQDIRINDCLNNRDRGDVAFYVLMDSSAGAIVRGRPREVVFLDFHPEQNYVPNELTEALFAWSNMASAWHGGMADVIELHAPNRNDLEPLMIQNRVVDWVQKAFDNIDPQLPWNPGNPGLSVNMSVLGRVGETEPTDGPVTRVYIGDGPFGENSPSGLAGIAPGDIFNQSKGLDIDTGKAIAIQKQILIFADNIFRRSNEFFQDLAGNPVGLNERDINGEITLEHVEHAIANTIIHELGHSLGLRHLDENLHHLSMNGLITPTEPFWDSDFSCGYYEQQGELYYSCQRDDNEIYWDVNQNGEYDRFGGWLFRIEQYFGITDEQLKRIEGFSSGDTQNSGERLAFSVGSDCDATAVEGGQILERTPPSQIVIDKDSGFTVGLLAALSSPVAVASAVLGIVPNGSDHSMPIATDLGSGDLETLLNRQIYVTSSDKAFFVASTTGDQFDIVGVPTSSAGSVSSIDLSNPLIILTDERIRGDLFDGMGNPVSTSLKLFLITPSGPLLLGDMGLKGGVTVTVPYLVGMIQSAASFALTGVGLTIGAISTQNSPIVPLGCIISQAPTAGTIVGPGTPVDLVVSSGPVAKVTVPNVVGLTQANAQTAITTEGLTVGNVTTQSSATVPAGSVISQNPAAGASVDAGSKVDLVVSSGPAKVSVPNVVGLTQANAQAAITAAGLTVGNVTTQSSATVPAGSVMSQNPSAGASVNAGSKVDLVVSSGPVAKVTVPNVVGLAQANAQAAITGAGLTVGNVTNQGSTTVPTGSVISQNPAAGASVDAGAKVDLIVSSGTAKITVPDVVGLTQSNAETAISGAGLSVGTVSAESSATVPFGSVISQDPAAGTAVDSGSEVDFIVSSGLPIFTLSNTPNKDTWVTDGAVWAIVPDGSKTYIGGTFNYVGPQTGGGVPLDITTGKPKGVFPRVEGTVYAVAADGAGGWYIGGNFTRVGGLIRNRIAHITQEGVVDASWNPDADAPVRALAVNGATVFAGGDFANIGGRYIYHLAALDASTGQAIDWNPNGCFVVSALALGGNTLYVGGPPGAVAYDATTGVQTSWDPRLTGFSAAVYALAVSGSTVYIGGEFSQVGPDGEKLPRNGLAAVDGVTGKATPWNPSPNNLVTALATDGKTVYAGGYFYGIGGEYRNNLAALDAATGQATPWDPNPSGTEGGVVNTLAVSGDTVFAGGWFTNIGGELRTHVAALDASTGKATSWKGGANGFVNALAVSGSTLYTGGSFMSAGGEYRRWIAALDTATGAATPWNPSATYSTSPYSYPGVYALAPSGSTVYVGGVFDEIGGQPRNAVAALDAVTGQATPWNPNIQGRIGVAPVPVVNALAVDDETIYVGGTFFFVGGQPRSCIAAIDASTGQPRAWDPDAVFENAMDQPPAVRSLLVKGSTIYAGGRFTNIGANRPPDQYRYNIAALDAATGEATPWAPDAEGSFSVGGTAVCNLVLRGTTIYVGGDFKSIGGKLRGGIAALDISSGTATPWNPNANGAVLALALNDTTVYAGGWFTSIGGVMRRGLAALDAVTGYATPWTPSSGDPNDPDFVPDLEVIQAMALDGTRLYLGHGHVSKETEIPLHFLSQFDEATQPVVPGAPTMRKAVAGNAQASVSFNTPASDGGSPITSYTVTSSPGGLTASGETSPISIGGLTNGTEYTFTVRAENAVGAGPESSSSNAVTPSGPPGEPTDVKAKAGNNQATVTFGAPEEDGGSPITSYIVTSYPERITKIGTGSPIVVSGLTNGTAYRFKVQAGNAVGVGPASAASKKVLVGAPDIPTEVSAVAGYGQATVSFNPPPPNGTSPVTSYMVTVYPGRTTKTGTGSPITVTGLINGKSYQFRVKAQNTSGWGPLSPPSNKVKPSTTAPGAPTRVKAIAGNAQAKVRFTPPVYTGGSPITSYTVTSNPGNLTASGASSPLKVKGLTNGTAYTFTVTANNAVGTGPPSIPSNSATPVASSVAPTSPKGGKERK